MKKMEREEHRSGGRFIVKMRRLTPEGVGFIDAVVDGKPMRFEVLKKGASILVNKVPLSQLELLFLENDKPKDLVKRLRLEVYTLVNRSENTTYLQQYRFLDTTLFLLDDGSVKLVRGDEELYSGSLEADEQLTLKLVEVARRHGLSEREAVGKVREAFKILKHFAKRLESVEVDGQTVKYADGVYARQTHIVDDEAYIALYLYGEWEVKEGIRVVGVKPVWFVSSNGMVRKADILPFFSSMNIIPVELRVVRNVVLDVAEFKEFKESIDAINRGEVAPPTFREVWNNVELLTATAMFIARSELMKSVSYTIHNWFYDFFKICPELAIVGGPGSGKTELRDRITALTRTIPLTQGSSLPAMRRIINTMFPGISFDEKTLSEPDIQSFLRASHRKSSFIVIADRENVNKIYTYDPYGPRILTCLPTDYAELREDTLGRHVTITMVRGCVSDRLNLSRENVWPVVKKLYLLLLYRWWDYLEAWKAVDTVVSRYLAGHGRDIVPIMLTPALLAGRDKFELLYEVLMEEFKVKASTLEAKLEYLVNGILRHIVSLETLDEDNPPPSIWVSPKDIVKANEGNYDGEDGNHKSWVRTLGRFLKNARSTKSLPFIKNYSDRRNGRYYEIEIGSFFKYATSYSLTLPEDVETDEVKLKTLKRLGLNLETVREPNAEEAYTQIKNTASISICEETPQIPQTPQKEAEGVISQKEAQNGLISEKPESSPDSGKKQESSPSGISGVCGVSSEKEIQGEFLICEENLQALLKATHGIQGYWSIQDIARGYYEAGGRDLPALIRALSSEDWIRSGRRPWLEEHPRVRGLFKLRR